MYHCTDTVSHSKGFVKGGGDSFEPGDPEKIPEISAHTQRELETIAAPRGERLQVGWLQVAGYPEGSAEPAT